MAGLRGNEPVKETASLAGSIRDTYWVHNRRTDVARFDKLGIGGAPPSAVK